MRALDPAAAIRSLMDKKVELELTVADGSRRLAGRIANVVLGVGLVGLVPDEAHVQARLREDLGFLS